MFLYLPFCYFLVLAPLRHSKTAMFPMPKSLRSSSMQVETHIIERATLVRVPKIGRVMGAYVAAEALTVVLVAHRPTAILLT
jgi:hypothetical protein